MKILNLYAGIGGNRKLWGDDYEITAVEWDKNIAKIYQGFFPRDKVLVEDAHDYLLKHFEEYDFIWSSPPCPSHSKIRNEAGVGRGQNKPVYPDMELYQEIILMKQMSKMRIFKGKYAIENVVSYYKPLVEPQEIARHYIWSNFFINSYKTKTRGHMLKNKDLIKIKGFEINDTKLLRNCTEPELGLHIFQEAFREYKKLF